MSNDLAAVIPQILAQGLLTLRRYSVLPLVCNRSYSPQPGVKGSTIDVPFATAPGVQAVSPGATPPSTSDIDTELVSIVLNKWHESPFYMTDQDITKAMNGTIPMVVSDAVAKLCNQVVAEIFLNYKSLYTTAGTAGTTPFASDLSAYYAARTAGNKNLMPPQNRFMVMDADAEGNALQRFVNTAASPVNSQPLLQGQIGDKVGAFWVMDTVMGTTDVINSGTVGSHTAGTVTGTISVSGTVAAGATSVLLAAGSGEAIALKAGDIIKFTGHAQTYTVLADLTVGASATGSASIYPAAAVALTGKDIDTGYPLASHVNNLLITPDCFVLATRPFADADNPNPNVLSQTDPVTNLTMRLEVTREHKRNRWSFDMLYGTKCLRPQFGVRVLG